MDRKGTLALTRKEGESIIIKTQYGEEIEIGIHQIQGKQATVFVRCTDSDTTLQSCHMLSTLAYTPIKMAANQKERRFLLAHLSADKAF